jgi:proteasome lid subunit RPN8/RPN11
MTVQPDRHTSSAIWQLTVAVCAWATYFAAIVVVYLIAFARGSLAGQRTAVWGMSLSLAIALVVFPAAAGRYEDARPVRLPAGLSGVIVAVALLAGSVAATWVTINLAVADQPAAGWSAALPAVAAPLAFLLTHASRRKPAAPAVGTERVTLPTVRRSTVRVRQTERVRRAGLINRNATARAQRGDAAVALDAGFWRAASIELRQQPKEQGGVALVTRAGDRVLVLGAIFPTQMMASQVRCEFSTVDVDRVRRALDQVADRLRIGPGEVTVTWVHTHPQLGVFLSGTDVETSRQWRQLDPRFTPIVIDINGQDLADQIGVFDNRNTKLGPVVVVDGIVNRSAAPRLVDALIRVYREDGVPDPLILLAGDRDG